MSAEENFVETIQRKITKVKRRKAREIEKTTIFCKYFAFTD
jgi:hypothetical protein